MFANYFIRPSKLHIFVQRRTFCPFTNPHSIKQSFKNISTTMTIMGSVYGMFRGFQWSSSTPYFIEEYRLKRIAFIAYNIYEGGCIGAICGFFFPITILGVINNKL
jgi:hypothetical protein